MYQASLEHKKNQSIRIEYMLSLNKKFELDITGADEGN